MRAKLDQDLVVRLKIRAAHHNRFAEAEHRAILEERCGAAPQSMTTLVDA